MVLLSSLQVITCMYLFYSVAPQTREILSSLLLN
jgi:hypothetical protein